MSLLVVRTKHRTPFLSSRTSPTASKLASRVPPLFARSAARTAESSRDAERLFNGFPTPQSARCFVTEIPETLTHVTGYPLYVVKELDLQSRVYYQGAMETLRLMRVPER